MEELDAADDGGLLDIWVGVGQADIDCLLHILSNAIELQRAKRSQRQASNLLVVALQVHEESVDRQDGQLLVLLSVVRQVKVDHLLHDHVIGARSFDHLWIQARHVDTQGHVCDDFLDDISFLGLVAFQTHCAQQESQLVHFAFLVVDEELRNGKIVGRSLIWISTCSCLGHWMFVSLVTVQFFIYNRERFILAKPRMISLIAFISPQR